MNNLRAGTPTVLQPGWGSDYRFFLNTSQPSTIRVSNGGTFNLNGNFYNTAVVSGYSAAGQYDYGFGDAGVDVHDYAKVNVTGSWQCGQVPGGRNGNGGFLTVQGYNASSSVNLPTLWMQPAATSASPSVFNVILDSTNTGGKFNTVQSNTKLELDSPSGAYSQPVRFNLVLSGYEPLVGDWFQIVNTPNLYDGSISGSLGTISVNGQNVSWNTPFIPSGSMAEFEFTQSHDSQSGVWLEVTSTVPEPGTLALLVAAALIGSPMRYRLGAARQ